MKKLLLLACAVGFVASSQAQFVDLTISAITSPSGTVYLDSDQNGDPVYSLSLEAVNNDVELPIGDAFFTVEYDGSNVPAPNGNWTGNTTTPWMMGETEAFTLTQAFTFEGDVGQADLCVTLTNWKNSSASTPETNSNLAPVCVTLTVEDTTTTSVNEHSLVLDRVIANGEIITVYASNNINQAVDFTLYNLAGQAVHTTKFNTTGSNFYKNINVTGVPAGIYIVRLTGDKGTSGAVQKVYLR